MVREKAKTPWTPPTPHYWLHNSTALQTDTLMLAMMASARQRSSRVLMPIDEDDVEEFEAEADVDDGEDDDEEVDDDEPEDDDGNDDEEVEDEAMEGMDEPEMDGRGGMRDEALDGNESD
jgi:hypothetical protein